MTQKLLILFQRHILNYPDPDKRLLKNGNVDHFIVACPNALGRIKQIELWSDCSGYSPEWYALSLILGYQLIFHSSLQIVTLVYYRFWLPSHPQMYMYAHREVFSQFEATILNSKRRLFYIYPKLYYFPRRKSLFLFSLLILRF